MSLPKIITGDQVLDRLLSVWAHTIDTLASGVAGGAVRVSALPAPVAALAGQQYRLYTAGKPEQLVQCLASSDGTYSWVVLGQGSR